SNPSGNTDLSIRQDGICPQAWTDEDLQSSQLPETPGNRYWPRACYPAYSNFSRRGAMETPVKFTSRERDCVIGVAMKYMKDEEKANDVTQDALLLAYRHRDSFRGDSRFTTWLYRIAATTSLMHLRKERSQPKTQSLVPEDADAVLDEPRSLYASP